jgi:hypothetical protein
VAGGVGGLVEVDDTGGDVRLEVALQRGAAIGNRGEVTGADENWEGAKSALIVPSLCAVPQFGRSVLPSFSFSSSRLNHQSGKPDPALTLVIVLEQQRPRAGVN